MQNRVWPLILMLLLASCSSETLNREAFPSGTMQSGLGSYNLPKADLYLELYYRTKNGSDGLIIAAAQPGVMPGESIPISSIFSSFSEDDFVVDVDPATGFLNQISLNLKDKSEETLVAAAGSFGAALAFQNPGVAGAPRQAKLTQALQDQLMASVEFDPTNEESVEAANAELWRQSVAFLQWNFAGKCISACKNSRVLRALNVTDPGALNPLKPPQGLSFVMSPSAKAVSSFDTPCHHPAHNGELADSAALRSGPGVCVRATHNVTIQLHVPGGPTVSQSALLPITGEEYLFNAERVLFATKTYTVDFKNGTAGKRHISQTSQALAIAGTPKAMIDAFVDSMASTTKALSNLVQLRLNYGTVLNSQTKTVTQSVASSSAPAGAPSSLAPAVQTVQTSTVTNTNNSDPTANPPTPPANGADKKGDAAPSQAPDAPHVHTPAAPAGSAVPANQASPQQPGTSQETQPPSAPAAPKLWFAVCSYGAECQGGLQSQIKPTSEADQGSAVHTTPPQNARPAPASPNNGAKPKCTTPEELATPACKPK